MDHVVLALITLFAATVNGALGYGFSSLTVPVALLFYTNRILNPALVWVEIVINSYVLLMNRQSVPQVWKRIVPMLFGVFLGVVIGSYILSSVHPGWLKFSTYCLLLPLILLQAAGVRRPIKSERSIGVPFGMGIGTLYSVTTISGPPLALLFNNQGYAKQDFRAALGVIRITESTLTAVAYYFLGLYTLESAQLIPYIAPSVLVGIPLGTYLISQMNHETFRRWCMSFDAIVVAFGMSRVIVELKLAPSPEAYSILALTMAVDGYLLFRFFRDRPPP